VRQVRIAASLLYALSILAAFIVTLIHGIFVACMVLLLFAYNRHLKGFPLVGNLAVSLLCGLAIYFPEFPSPLWNTLPAFVFAFLATFAREVVKDIEDIEGDRVAGLCTLPLVFSVNGSRKLAFSLVAILLAILPLPIAYFGYHWPYLLLATVLAAPFLIMLLVELSKPTADYGRCQRYLKWVMIGGMVALWVGMVGH
jgi:4-hydroxybenzoate polyprenyltransferase